MDTQFKRIYVLLPAKVLVPKPEFGALGDRLLPMPVGRSAIQLGHVVSKMRVGLADTYGSQPITTIGYSVRNHKELIKLINEMSAGGFNVWGFYDRDPKFYESDHGVLTAVCTEPITREQAEPFLGHLELFAK